MCDLISVIIPVYNIKPYLDKCLESICNQTYQNFEVLLIDDGSTDGSYEKCQNYSTKYSFVRSFQQQHKGVSAARNFGIQEAKGKYLAFIDGDDTIDSNYLEILERYMSTGKYDIVFCGCRVIDVKHSKVCLCSISQNHFGDLRRDFFDLYTGITRVSIGTPVCKLFDKNKIARMNLAFNECFINHEDAIFSFSYLGKCNTYYITNETFYNYYKYERGSATEILSEERVENEFDFLNFVNHWLLRNRIVQREAILGSDIVAFIGGMVAPLRQANRKFSNSYIEFINIVSRIAKLDQLPRKTAKFKSTIVLWCTRRKLFFPVFIYYWIKALVGKQ